MYDLIVIGGGPAGSSAAIAAARAGAQVLLLERGRYPRHKVCGEFVSAESLDLLSTLLGTHDKALLNQAIPISHTRLFVDDRVIEIPITPAAASIARFDLDATLWHAAQNCGVEAHQQTTVQRFSGDGPFSVSTSLGEFDARALINTSGRWSNLTAPLKENGNIRDKWVGLKAHFGESAPSQSVDLYFFKGGYCGVQPARLLGADQSADPKNGDQNTIDRDKDRINVCAMVRVDTASTLLDVFWQNLQLRERSGNWQPLTEPVTTSPLFFRPPRPVQGTVLMAGDAAGFVDPFVGDGISLALRSSALAAKSLQPFFRGENSLGKAADSYRKAYEHTLQPVFRASSRIRRMLALPQALRGLLLSFLQSSPGLTRYLVHQTR